MQSARKTIGLIAGGFKPFTAGHYNLVQRASSECDKVKLFVSTGDRARKGELAITWAQMQTVWNDYLETAINNLGNVDIVYTKTPIRSVIDLLIEANADITDMNTDIIYSDPEDMSNNFSDRVQDKYWPWLKANDQVILQPVGREEAGNISGTVMRKALAKGDRKAFIAGLPEPVRLYGPDIFERLR